LPNRSITVSATGVGGDVEVGRRAPEQHVAHAAAHQVRLVPGARSRGTRRARRAECARCIGARHGFHLASIASSAAAAAPCSASFFDRPTARP
jgi:hypothetical protein